MKRRWILMLMVLCLTVTVTFGAAAASKVKITFSCGSAQQNTLTKLAEQFNAANPDIQVELLVQPAQSNQHYDRLVTVFAAKDSSIDVLYMDVIWPGTFISNGWLAPLDKYFTPAMQNDFLKGAVKNNTLKGVPYGVPLFSDGGLFYYRKDLLEKYKYDVPETWDDLVKVAQAITEKEKDPNLKGYLFQGFRGEGAVCNWLEILWSIGGNLLDENGNLVMNKDNKGLQALQMMIDFKSKSKISPNSVATDKPDDSRISFLNGRGVFMRNWTFAYASLEAADSIVKGKVGVTYLPHGAGPSASCLGGWGVGISAFSKNKDAAWKFVNFLTSYESQKALALGESTLPTRSAVYNDAEILKAMPWFEAFGKGLAGVEPRPAHPKYLEVSAVLQQEFNAAISGGKSAKDAIDASTKEINAILK